MKVDVVAKTREGFLQYCKRYGLQPDIDVHYVDFNAPAKNNDDIKIIIDDPLNKQEAMRDEYSTKCAPLTYHRSNK